MADFGDAPSEGGATAGAQPAASPNAAPQRDMKALAKKWLPEIERAKRAAQPYIARAKKIVDIYTEQRKTASQPLGTTRHFSILWSNIAVLQPATYSRPPSAVIQRRFRDRDPVARTSCELIERAVAFMVDHNNLDGVLKAVRDDYLLVARGTSWVRYEATFKQEPVPVPPGVAAPVGPDGLPLMQEVIASENVIVDFVHWDNFIHPQVRTWAELPWATREVYLTQERAAKRFGEEIAARLSYTHRPEGVAEDEGNKANQAMIWETWSKVDREVYWFSPGFDEALDAGPPPLELHDFWPFPRPAYGTLATNSLTPVPDYVYYQDQAEEIDDLTQRISALSDQLKVVGFYPAGPNGEGSAAIERAAAPGFENKLIPVASWAGFSEKGGVTQIQWWPVEQAAKVLEASIKLRQQLIEDVYQVTGISDIVRGETEASETATAQRIKAQWGSIRVRERQTEMVRYARDLIRIIAEVVADKFQPETLLAMTGLQLRTDAQVQAEFQAKLAQWRLAMQQQMQGQPPIMALGGQATPPQPAPQPPQQGVPA